MSEISIGKLRHGDKSAREVSARVGGNCATTAVVTAIGPLARADGMIVVVDNQEWIFIAGDSTTASATCLAPDDATSNDGRWKTSKATFYGSATSGITSLSGITGIIFSGFSASVSGGVLRVWIP